MLLILQVEGDSINECLCEARQVLDKHNCRDNCYGGFTEDGNDFVVDIVDSTCDAAFEFNNSLKWVGEE